MMSFDTTPYQNAPQPPPGPLQNAPKRRISGLAWLAIIGIPVAGVLGVIGATNGPGLASNTEGYAVVHCQEAVKKELKSPSTASFQETTATGDGTWAVTGSVDSENGFGATVRPNFTCSVIVDDDGGRVRVDSLTQR